jgi:hypothetical protein
VIGIPRLNPWPDAFFQFGDEPGGDAVVNILFMIGLAFFERFNSAKPSKSRV